MPETIAHPYIPNSVPSIKEAMLREIGVERADELYAAIPERLRFGRPARHPCRAHAPRQSCAATSRRCSRRTRAAREPSASSAAAAGSTTSRRCATRSSNRGEFLTAYYGETYTDHGKLQAFFEYASMVGELVELRRGQPADLRLGVRGGDARSAWPAAITGRGTALVPASTLARATRGHRRLLQAAGSPSSGSRSTPTTGPLDLDALAARCRRRRRLRLRREPGLPRHDRARVARDRRPRARCGRPRGRRRRPDLARRARGAAALRRRHRLRRAAAARHPHALRRRPRRASSRRRTTERLRRRVPDVPGRARADVRGRVRLRRGALGAHVVRPARRVARLRGHDAVPLGDRRRRLPRAARAGRDGASSGRAIMQRTQYAAAAPRRAPGRARARRSTRPSSRSSWSTSSDTGKTVAEVNRGAPRGGHLRRP